MSVSFVDIVIFIFTYLFNS